MAVAVVSDPPRLLGQLRIRETEKGDKQLNKDLRFGFLLHQSMSHERSEHVSFDFLVWAKSFTS